MPLNVTIDINGEPIERVKISRMEEFKGRDEWHEYMIRSGSDPEGVAFYSHKYSEGAVVCVQKGLDALARKRGSL